MSADSISPAPARTVTTVGGRELRLHPSVTDLERGILIRGMDGTLYWVSETKLATELKDGGCKLPVDDQPLKKEAETPENEIRRILQDRLDDLPAVVNVRNAILGHLRVKTPGQGVPGGPTQPRGGKVADDALSRLVVYVERAIGGSEPPNS